ncbi:hypothetical protein GXW82_04495 [Streptacidiphilus sp. 4-A2]|nr:hypothetical protein [Streptacidiphilus sp. 4-A2]
MPAGQVDERVARAARYRFDLGAEPPFRALLLTVEQRDEQVLLLLLHHIAGDGWSLAPLVADLSRAYAGRLPGGVPGLPSLPASYPELAARRRAALGSPQQSTPGCPATRLLAAAVDGTRGGGATAAAPPDRPPVPAGPGPRWCAVWTGAPPPRSRRRPGPREPPCSWPCTPRWPPCSTWPGPGPTWPSAPRWPDAARTAARTTRSASSSTCWCCAPTPAATRPRASCCAGSAPATWARSPTRSCPTSRWSRRSTRPGCPDASPSPRWCWCSRTTRRRSPRCPYRTGGGHRGGGAAHRRRPLRTAGRGRGADRRRRQRGRLELVLEYRADTLEESFVRWVADALPQALTALAELPDVPLSLLPLPAPPRRAGEPDRCRLPERVPRRNEAPQGPLEQEVAAVWAEVLGVTGIGRHDDFFALGGNSLRAVRAAVRLSAGTRQVTAALVFEAPTVAAHAAALRDAPDVPEPAPIPRRARVPRRPADHPRSQPQESPWTSA